jgi:hypothetical protein
MFTALIKAEHPYKIHTRLAPDLCALGLLPCVIFAGVPIGNLQGRNVLHGWQIKTKITLEADAYVTQRIITWSRGMRLCSSGFERTVVIQG